MAKLFRQLPLALLMLLIGYILLVQVLRSVAFGDAEREALALMEQPLEVPEGPGGFKYVAFPNLEVPFDELDAALAEDVAAFRPWHAGQGERMTAGMEDRPDSQFFESPIAARYPPRETLSPPDGACSHREEDCIAKLRGHEPRFREWLVAEADRLELANQALGSEHLANPYPIGMDTPLAAYALLRLPLHAAALRSLDGDHAGALAQACDLLAASRRFVGQDGLLIDKMVHASLAQGAAGLVLAIRRADPASPMPEACRVALAPVVAGDYLICNALRAEYEMGASMARQWDAALAKSWHPVDVGSRWVLVDSRLQRGWSARSLAPLCRPQEFAAISEARLPELDTPEFSKTSVAFWAAPVSNILAAVSLPSYNDYQHRLLDHAAVLRLQLAAIAHANGELEADQVAVAGASPGYELSQDAEGWRLSLLSRQGSAPSEFRVGAANGPATENADPN